MTWTFRDTKAVERADKETAVANIAANTYDGVLTGIGKLGVYDEWHDKEEWRDGKKTGNKFKVLEQVLKGKIFSEVTTLANGQATRYKGEQVGRTVSLGTVIEPKYDADGEEVWADDLWKALPDGREVLNEKVYRAVSLEVYDPDIKGMIEKDFIVRRTVSYASNAYKELKTICGEDGIPADLDDDLTQLIGKPTRFDVEIYVVPDIDEKTGRENRNAGASYSFIKQYQPFRAGGDAEIILPPAAKKPTVASLPQSKRSTLPTGAGQAPHPVEIPASKTRSGVDTRRTVNLPGVGQAVVDRPKRGTAAANIDGDLDVDDIPF